MTKLATSMKRVLSSNEQVHEFSILLHHSFNMLAKLSSGARDLNFGLSHLLHPYFVCALSEGSG